MVKECRSVQKKQSLLRSWELMGKKIGHHWFVSHGEQLVFKQPLIIIIIIYCYFTFLKSFCFLSLVSDEYIQLPKHAQTITVGICDLCIGSRAHSTKHLLFRVSM